jgi:uncharacterized protein (TIGR03083 family)
MVSGERHTLVVDFRMDQTRFLSCLEADCLRIRKVAPGRLDQRVPTCPDWTVADLIRHVAQVYQHKVEIMRDGKEPEVWPPAGFGTADPLGLLDDSYSQLSREFGSRDPGEACPTFYGPDQTVGFWIRRMAQETVVHRIDAELGAGAAVAPVPRDLAVDGVDELLHIFMGWGFTEWPEDFADALRNSPGHRFLIRADATADSQAVSWLVRTGAGQLTVEGGPGTVAGATGVHDVSVTGSPAAVLRWAWNREAAGKGGEVIINGDSDAVTELRACLFEATQ